MWHRAKQTMRLVALLSIFSLLLAACGGASDTPTTSANGAGAVTDTPSSAAAATNTTAPAAGAAATNTTAPAAGAAATNTTAPAAGGAATNTTAPSGGAAATGTAPASAGTGFQLPATCSNVQVAYWNGLTGPDGPHMGNLVTSFNAANSNIKVTETRQADYTTKLDTAAASDTLPDVAIINEDQIATQAYRHVIRPMDTVVQQMGIQGTDFPAAAWTLANVAGHPYGIPLSMVPMTMYYNPGLLKDAGFSAPPTNGDDFAKVAAAITKGKNHGFMITTGFPVQQIFQMLLHQYGGSEYSADGTQATWNSDAGVKALQWMKDAQSKYSAPKLAVDADLNAFKSGTVGMIWNGIWQTSNVTGDAVDFGGMATAPPQIGPNPATWAGMALLSLPVHKKGEDPCKTAAAGMLIKYLVDNAVEWSKGGNIPASNAVRQSAAFQAIQPQASIAPAMEHPVFPPPIPGIADAFAPLGTAVGAVMAGTTTDIKGTLDKAAQQADQILTQNHQNYGTNPETSNPPTATPAPK